MPSACFTFPLGQFQRPARSFYLVREDFGAVHAEDTGIVSSDIVGYSTDNLTGGKFNMSGVVFNSVGGGALDLNDMTFPGVTGSDYQETSDQIQVWDPPTSGYTIYYYYYDASAPEDNGWYGTLDEETTLPAGTAFWYKAKAGNGKQMTQSGAVESDADVTFNLTGGKFNMAINPYPTAVDLNDSNTVEFAGVTGSDYQETSDQIQVWDTATSGYTIYYYYYDASTPEDNGWYGTLDEEAVLPAGTAFWYKAKAGSGKSITFKKTW